MLGLASTHQCTTGEGNLIADHHEHTSTGATIAMLNLADAHPKAMESTAEAFVIMSVITLLMLLRLRREGFGFFRRF